MSRFIWYISAASISFNFWKLFGLIAFLSPQFQLVYWTLLLIAIIIHLSLTMGNPQVMIANQTGMDIGVVALTNTSAMLACLFSALTTIIELIMGVI